MRGTRKILLCMVMVVGALSFSACGSSVPSPPASVGEDYPGGGIPISVTWSSDWLEGFVGESEATGGPIVGLRLEYVDDRWVWRIRSLDPGRDVLGESITEPDRGREALVDASTRALMATHHVTLTNAELTAVKVSAYDAAQLSGEVYPSPRLVELELQMADGEPTWRITTHDSETNVQSVISVSAL